MAIPAPALGVVKHEKADFDPVQRHIDLPEDVDDGHFYRFVPHPYPEGRRADLPSGRTEVAVVGGDDPQQTRSVEWRRSPCLHPWLGRGDVEALDQAARDHLPRRTLLAAVRAAGTSIVSQGWPRVSALLGSWGLCGGLRRPASAYKLVCAATTIGVNGPGKDPARQRPGLGITIGVTLMNLRLDPLAVVVGCRKAAQRALLGSQGLGDGLRRPASACGLFDAAITIGVTVIQLSSYPQLFASPLTESSTNRHDPEISRP